MSEPTAEPCVPAWRTPLAACGAALLALVACNSPAEWAAEADEDVYDLLAAQREVLGFDGGFTITPAEDNLRDRLLAGELPEMLSGLTLAQCQRIAAQNSRDYQTRRESLYLTALDLSLEMFQYGWRLDDGGFVDLSGGSSGAEGLTVDYGIALRKTLGNGADVVLDIGANFFESLANGDPSLLLSSASLTITRPLLQGGSTEAIYEPLTRAQRRVVDEARTYERFRRSFGVDVFSRFYRILEQHEVVENERANVESLTLLSERNDQLVTAGRMDDIQAGQATQDLLRARSRLISSEAQLEGLYDDFKFFLGLPVAVQIRLDRTAFTAMADEGIDPVTIEEAAATGIALADRLDIATTRDEFLDAERRLRIAETELRSLLDLSLTASGDSPIEPGLEFESGDVNWGVGLNFDTPLDRQAERNAYRASQIALDAALRALERDEDSVRIDVRDDLRNLQQAREDFNIQENSVLLAKRRVESTELKLDAGRAETRDLLEARDSLVAAQNARVSSLVDYKLARLTLLLDMEQLVIDEEGVRARDPLLLNPLGEVLE